MADGGSASSFSDESVHDAFVEPTEFTETAARYMDISAIKRVGQLRALRPTP